MATKRTASRKSRKSKSAASASSRAARNYYNLAQEWSAKPVVRYVAGGIAAAVLARIALKMSGRYPEIVGFIRDNLDTVETKLREFRDDFGSRSEETSAQH